MCKRNGETWILGHRAWSETESAFPFFVHSGEFIDDPNRRGFLLLNPMQDLEQERDESKPSHSIYFILVDKEHRREGVGSALVAMIPKSFYVWLEVVTEDEGKAPEAFWRSQPGFHCTKRFSDDCVSMQGDLEFERPPTDPTKCAWKREGGRLERV